MEKEDRTEEEKEIPDDCSSCELLKVGARFIKKKASNRELKEVVRKKAEQILDGK